MATEENNIITNLIMTDIDELISLGLKKELCGFLEVVGNCHSLHFMRDFNNNENLEDTKENGKLVLYLEKKSRALSYDEMRFIYTVVVGKKNTAYVEVYVDEDEEKCEDLLKSYSSLHRHQKRQFLDGKVSLKYDLREKTISLGDYRKN